MQDAIISIQPVVAEAMAGFFCANMVGMERSFTFMSREKGRELSVDLLKLQM